MTRNIYSDEQSNAIRTSEFDIYEGVSLFSNVAAKFVLNGKETYYLRNKKFEVNSGEYILGNNYELTEVKISELTSGLCVDISNNIIAEVLESMFNNPDFGEFLLTDRFLFNKYNSKNSSLGYQLSELSGNLFLSTSNAILTSELFYSIAEKVVIDQALIFKQISKLNFKKCESGKEVFRNLLNAKNYIDDCFLQNLSINDLIRTALLSKYAFIRLFKQCFGNSPYNYILQKRLHYAREKILNGAKISDIAFETQFADTPAFSKAFKKFFGYSPSHLLK